MTRNKTLNKIRVMLALDLSKMDIALIKYLNYLSKTWDIEQVDFVHNIKQTELYSIYEEIADDSINLEEIISKNIQETIEEHIHSDIVYDVHISSDNYTESVLSHQAKSFKTDILILGKKSSLRGTGSMTRKLVRMIDCNILLVPENVACKLDKILIPTDFTVNSSSAFKIAEKLQEYNSFEMNTVHVYSIPSVYFPFINRDEAKDKAERHLKQRYQTFVKRHKLQNIPFHLIYQQNKTIAELIIEYMDKEQMDLCVLSARGGNKITALLIGSITNELLLEEVKKPILIVK